MKLLPAPKSIFERYHVGVDFGNEKSFTVLSTKINLTDVELSNCLGAKYIRIGDSIYTLKNRHHLENIKLNRYFNLKDENEFVLIELIR